MKKDKLYTINRWNANIFWPGGDLDKGITDYGNTSDNPYRGISLSSDSFGSMVTNPGAKPFNPYSFVGSSYTGNTNGNYGYTVNGQNTVNVGSSEMTAAVNPNKSLLPSITDAAANAFQKVITNKDKPATVDNVQGEAPSFMDKYGGLIGTGVSMLADAIPTESKYKRGLWDAADPVYHLAGGKESGVGNALSDVGVGLTKAGLSTGNYWLAAAGAGAKIVGGLWNGAFGFDWNDDLINSIKDNTNKMNYAGSAFGQAKTSSDFFNAAGLMGNSRTFNNSDIGSSGWFRSNRKINNKANALRAQQSAAEAFQGGNMVQSARKIDKRMDDIARRNQFAYGGLFGNSSGSLGLMQQNAALSALQQQQPLLKKGIFGSMFAEGGYKPTTFIDSFSADPIGTIVNYRNQLDQQALAQQQAEAEARRAEEYAALQDRLSAIESQNQGLQAQLAAMPTTPLTVPEELMSTPLESTPVDVSSSATPVSSSYYSQALAGTRGKNKTWDYVEDQLRKSGKFNDIQLLGIKSNLERESGMQYNVIGDNGAAYGLGQWHGARQPKDKSLAGQTNLLLNSLSTFDRNHWVGKENYEGFMNARTPEEAHYYLAAGYERPKKSIIAKLKKESDESLKNLKAMGGNLFAEGGNIEIKHPGRLTELKERTGKTEAELWAEGKPEVRKMITFARNARKWQKAYGGFLNATGNLFPDGGLIKPKQRIENGLIYDERPRKGVSSSGYRHVEDPNSTYAVDEKGNVVDYSTRLPEFTLSVDNRNIQKKMADAYGGLGRSPKYHSTPLEQIEEGYNFFWPGKMKYAPYALGVTALNIPSLLSRLPEGIPYEELSPAIETAANAAFTLGPILSAEAGEALAEKENKKAYGGLLGNNNLFALGGNVHAYGADWTNGLTVIDTGDSHEANPLGGVQMGVDEQGVPNLVEEGETVYNDYVFSDRLKIPEFMYKELGLKQSKAKKEISFADASKEIAKESQQRPNDPISRKGLQASMAKLAQVQETLKAAQEAEQEQNSFALGGRIANVYKKGGDSNREYTTYTVQQTPTTPATPVTPTPNPAFGTLGTTPFTFGTPYSLEDAVKDKLYQPNLEVKPFDAPKTPLEEAWKYEDNSERVNPPLYPTWMRYIPAIGGGFAALTDSLGWTNKPDYTYADKLEAMANRAGYVPNIDYKPVGQYRRYNPMDIWYAKNFNDAQARATGRAITNSAAPIGTKMAGQLANNYVNQMSTAELYNKALAYNDALQNAVATFNRGTDMFNSQQDLAASEANARYRQMAWQYGLSGLAQAAAMRNAIDQRVGAARSANLTNFLTSLGNIGRENFAMNQINSDRSRHYYGTLSGTSGYKRDTKKKEG